MRYTEVRTAAEQGEARRLASENPKRIVIIERYGPRSVLFQCPCGCSDVLVINVDKKLRQAWTLRYDARGVSLLPSVWRTTGCESHFVLWQSQAWWCRFLTDDRETEPGIEDDWPEELGRELRRAWYERWMR